MKGKRSIITRYRKDTLVVQRHVDALDAPQKRCLEAALGLCERQLSHIGNWLDKHVSKDLDPNVRRGLYAIVLSHHAAQAADAYEQHYPDNCFEPKYYQIGAFLQSFDAERGVFVQNEGTYRLLKGRIEGVQLPLNGLSVQDRFLGHFLEPVREERLRALVGGCELIREAAKEFALAYGRPWKQYDVLRFLRDYVVDESRFARAKGTYRVLLGVLGGEVEQKFLAGISDAGLRKTVQDISRGEYLSDAIGDAGEAWAASFE